MDKLNIFTGIPANHLEEWTDTLWKSQGLHVERIVSHGHASPPGQWYDQDADEWVLLLTGSAGLSIDGCDGILELRPGDHVLLPAHRKHRVEWTDARCDTIWLAVHHRPA